MKHEEMIAVIRAHADGKDIQVKRKVLGSKWRPASTPCWDFDMFDYREKPEPFECWIRKPIIEEAKINRTRILYPHKEDAQDACGTHYKVVHMREVIE